MRVVKKLGFAYILLIMGSVISCKENIDEKWKNIRIYPNDKSQMITIITNANKRYFIDGEHQTIPDSSYFMVDISSVDQLGDGISVCWGDSGYKWKISSAYATLMESKLDTSKFLYYQPLGKYGEPVSTGYEGDHCGGILIRENFIRGNINVNY